jgi:hypothetical protein
LESFGGGIIISTLNRDANQNREDQAKAEVDSGGIKIINRKRLQISTFEYVRHGRSEEYF